MVERFNRTCQQMLKVFVNENRDDWDDHLPYLMMAYRSSPHESTGLSPNMMMFGEELALPIDLMVGAPPRHNIRYKCRVEYVEWLRNTLGHAHLFARQQLGISANRQKTYYDKKSNPISFPTGSFVWWWYPPKANRKLGIGWSGPFRVMQRPTDIHCVIQLSPDAQSKRVHINQLKPHLGRQPAAWADYVPAPDEQEEPTEMQLAEPVPIDLADNPVLLSTDMPEGLHEDLAHNVAPFGLESTNETLSPLVTEIEEPEDPPSTPKVLDLRRSTRERKKPDHLKNYVST